jgi:Nif-specific regulatory protein
MFAFGKVAMKRFAYDELAVLYNLARIFTTPQDLREQLEETLQVLSEQTGMGRGMISILDRDSGEAILDLAHGVDIEGLDITYKPGEGITGKVAQTGKPMIVRDLGTEEHFLDRTGARRNLDRSELSFICVPIIYDSRVVGVLSADKVIRAVDCQDDDIRFLSEVANLIAQAVHMRAVEEENRRLKNILGRSQRPSTDILGNSKEMKEIFGQIFQVADSNATVLIYGETGTGKELVARAIHRNSSRVAKAFVEVNCAALPDTLIESELFGHAKGAFTGAHQRRRGRFEEGHSGAAVSALGRFPYGQGQRAYHRGYKPQSGAGFVFRKIPPGFVLSAQRVSCLHAAPAGARQRYNFAGGFFCREIRYPAQEKHQADCDFRHRPAACPSLARQCQGA